MEPDFRHKSTVQSILQGFLKEIGFEPDPGRRRGPYKAPDRGRGRGDMPTHPATSTGWKSPWHGAPPSVHQPWQGGPQALPLLPLAGPSGVCAFNETVWL